MSQPNSALERSSLHRQSGGKQLRRISVPRRPVREALMPIEHIEQRRGSWEPSVCGYCKGPLPRKGLKFRGRRCRLRYSVEVAKPIEKVQARLAKMRAAGLSPRHGGVAAGKSGFKISIGNRRRAVAPKPMVGEKR